ncbi:hypothetical protein F4780DRAFT_718754 [Xylariomycetidae sp. FL0641]|nr:hypothetical protein F4780DRAFT_767427 [Xylariomycetidae sp. FL0641]KAI0026153.1 hypothetical protein F4780DRAFT_718754 [Xylariomycetidae sp. FL0641]
MASWWSVPSRVLTVMERWEWQTPSRFVTPLQLVFISYVAYGNWESISSVSHTYHTTTNHTTINHTTTNHTTTNHTTIDHTTIYHTTTNVQRLFQIPNSASWLFPLLYLGLTTYIARLYYDFARNYTLTFSGRLARVSFEFLYWVFLWPALLWHQYCYFQKSIYYYVSEHEHGTAADIVASVAFILNIWLLLNSMRKWQFNLSWHYTAFEECKFRAFADPQFGLKDAPTRLMPAFVTKLACVFAQLVFFLTKWAIAYNPPRNGDGRREIIDLTIDEMSPDNVPPRWRKFRTFLRDTFGSNITGIPMDG